MMIRGQKNRFVPAYLIMLLLIFHLLSGCSGCSKSGRKIVTNNTKLELVDSENEDQDNSENSVDPSIVNSVKEIEDANNIKNSIGDDVYGIVFSIVDGDTYDILIEDNKKIRIRMEGIDAPETGMPFSQVSKNYLGKLCFNKNVKVHVTKLDNIRYIGFSYLDDGTELSHEMIRAGLAWHFTKFNTDVDLSNLEIEARDAKVGLWKDNNPMPPWENRRLHRQGISTKDLYY
jgi:endonuclease YncB( thermonuclease family)